jgi:hypothetical protein
MTKHLWVIISKCFENGFRKLVRTHSFYLSYYSNHYSLVDTFYGKLQIRKFILSAKLFWPTVRKNCSSDQEKLLKFETEGQEFENFLRSLEQFIQTVKGQNNIW